ncbi:unnamed protein product, partial [Boreogadus saida]
VQNYLPPLGCERVLRGTTCAQRHLALIRMRCVATARPLQELPRNVCFNSFKDVMYFGRGHR